MVLLIALVLAGAAIFVTSPAWAVPPRGEDPVTVLGAALPDFDGVVIAELALFRWDAALPGFVPIPFQIDEKTVTTFNPGTQYMFTELMYDVAGVEDGTVDANDELVFLLQDVGPRAPVDAPLPAGSDGTRYEIQVTDPAPSSSTGPGWVYLFRGDDLELDLDPPLPVDGDSSQAATLFVTPHYSVEYQDKWLLTEYTVAPGCGTGADLIDRFKGRAGLAPHQGETEELWNLTATYLGGIQGPIRAIRYVRGAASGVNTIHHDVLYASFWERWANLRVHPIPNVYLYMDMRPATGTKFLTPSAPTGVDVDGVADTGVGTALPPWALVRGPDGGFATIYDVPPSPFVGSIRLYYRDDANYNDINANNPNNDEDDSSFGSHGVELNTLTSEERDLIPGRLRFVPLCSGEGDAASAALLRERYDYAPVTAAEYQIVGLGTVGTAAVTRQGDDVVVDWPDLAGAISYLVYSSTDPALPHESWTLEEDVDVSRWTDAAILLDPEPRYYNVVAVGIAGEGPW